jgi:hypothetical protein
VFTRWQRAFSHNLSHNWLVHMKRVPGCLVGLLMVEVVAREAGSEADLVPDDVPRWTVV